MSTENAGRDFPGEYRLDVEDFGPIAKASVDLRPLTVFIGPSNTGKSYLAILVYALHQCLQQVNIYPYGPRPRYRSEPLASEVHALLDADDNSYTILDSFRNWIIDRYDNRFQQRLAFDIDSDSESERNETKTDSWNVLPKDLESYLRSAFQKAPGVGRSALREIGRCFGVDYTRSLVRRSGSGSFAKVALSIPRLSGDEIVKYEFRLHDDRVELFGEIGGKQSLSSEIDDLDELTDRRAYARRYQVLPDSGYEELKYSLSRVAEDIFVSLLRPICRSAYYLPADRTGVMHSHQVVVSTLIQNATTAGLNPSSGIPILSGVLADFLSQLIEMSAERERIRLSSPYDTSAVSEKLARQLEQDLLGGVVEVEGKATGYPTFDYRPTGWGESLPLMRASSMVSELAPVVLYLRHLVRRDDVVIIEEPESHLHPAMQVEFTRQLAGLVRAGIRVIVTTHSEWVLQELANVVRASALPEGERKGIAGGDVALDASQVGAWFFKPDPNGEGSTVSEIGLDEESGLYPTDFEEVARAMHNDWAEIFSRLGEAE